MSEAAHSLQRRAAECWARGDLYGADDALRALIDHQGGPRPETDQMTLRLALDLLEFERAGAALSRLKSAGKLDTQASLSAARLLTWQGQREEAIAIMQDALKADPDHPGLLALLITHANHLPQSTLDHAERVADTLPDRAIEKTGLFFPLARHYDRASAYERSWSLVSKANQIAAERTPKLVDPEALKSALIRRASNALKRFAALKPAPRHDQRHVYLIGAPRTGSSLLQSILSAHDGVDSSGERGALLPFLHEITDSTETPPSDYLTRLQTADLSGLQRSGHHAPLLIDKTTHNAFVAPLIAAIHPESVFVNVIRRPHDVALSMLFHEFPPAFPESTSLEGIAAMLEARADIMALYKEAAFDVHQIDFDAFTNAPETQARTLAGWIGLEFDPGTLSPENRNAAVPTFSAGQVRQPIRPTPADKWQRFEPFLSNHIKERLDALTPSL
ncbi:MAG: sulfotransferase [Pseudomonadota bacterium]